MTAQQNTDHIQTTHTGSLPRPHHLLDLLKAKFSGNPLDASEWDTALAKAVTDCVRKQVECGIDTVTDGEFSKPGFFTYTFWSAWRVLNHAPGKSQSHLRKKFPLS